MLYTKEHYVYVYKGQFVLSLSKLYIDKLRTVYLSVRCWQHCGINKVLMVTGTCRDFYFYSQVINHEI